MILPRIREAHPHFSHRFSLQKYKNRKHIMDVFTTLTCFLLYFWEKAILQSFTGKTREKAELLLAFGNCHGNGNRHAHHGVIARAEEAHHLHIRIRPPAASSLRHSGLSARKPVLFPNKKPVSIVSVTWFAYIIAHELFTKPDVLNK